MLAGGNARTPRGLRSRDAARAGPRRSVAAVLVAAPQLADIPVQGAARRTRGSGRPPRSSSVASARTRPTSFWSSARSADSLERCRSRAVSIVHSSPPAQVGGRLEIAFAEVGLPTVRPQARRAACTWCRGAGRQPHHQERAQICMSQQRPLLLVACRLDDASSPSSPGRPTAYPSRSPAQLRRRRAGSRRTSLQQIRAYPKSPCARVQHAQLTQSSSTTRTTSQVSDSSRTASSAVYTQGLLVVEERRRAPRSRSARERRRRTTSVRSVIITEEVKLHQEPHQPRTSDRKAIDKTTSQSRPRYRA